MTSASTDFPIEVEFTGGLELLFSNERNHTINIPLVDSTGSKPTVSWLVHHLCDNVMKDPRKDMFVLDRAVRPGILVLINDADWALEGEAAYELQKNDKIVFLSTLHGG